MNWRVVIDRLRRRFHRSMPRAALTGALLDRAHRASTERRYRDAATLFAEASALATNAGPLHVQAGHMFKEAGDLAAAESHYGRAAEVMPHDADLALQLGHFFKVADRAPEAIRAYRRAGELQPGWAEPAREVERLVGRADTVVRDHAIRPTPAMLPELLPDAPSPTPTLLSDVIELRRLGGRREATPRGPVPLLSGVEALRGVCVSRARIVLARVLVDDRVIREGVPDAIALSDGRTKYVFNLWFDLSAFEPGAYVVTTEVTDDRGTTRERHEPVLIAPPMREAYHPGADGVVDPVEGGPAELEEHIRTRATMVRSAIERGVLPDPVRSVLVLRTDQLGDMVVSIPAIRRLRALFPEARIGGLVTAANADLARVSGLFDDLIIADFPDVLAQRRRTMTSEEQARLAALLGPRRFDVAIDLATSHMSRPLLRLTGARFTMGFDDRAWPWMSAGIEGGTHDSSNHLEIAPQSAKVLALVERLGTLRSRRAEVMVRSDLDPERLRSLGLDPARPFMVAHTGARIAFSRWRGYPALVDRLIAETPFDVAILTDDDDFTDRLSANAVASRRVVCLDRRLTFDDLDTLLSFAAVFVGNDSGPKHLASLRGTPVVSLHSARINWGEWGQEQTGLILSRRVPCAGCAIYHDVEECGKDYACIVDIRVEEVMAAVHRLTGRSDLDFPAR